MRSLWSHPPLPDHIREQIARVFVRHVCPSIAIINVVSTSLVYALHGMDQPSRYLPNAPIFLMLLISVVFILRDRWLTAARLLMLGLIGATSVGVLLNSVLAPAYWANLILLPLAPALFGARRSLVFVFWIALSGGCGSGWTPVAGARASTTPAPRWLMGSCASSG